MPQPVDRVMEEAAIGILELSANKDSSGWKSFKIEDCPYWGTNGVQNDGDEQLDNDGGIFVVSPQFVTRRLCLLPTMNVTDMITHF